MGLPVSGQVTLETINLPESGLRRHVVIAGGGRIGRQVAQILENLGLLFVIIELDHYPIENIKKAGFPLVYGDATQPVVLEAAGIEDARLLIVTVPAVFAAQSVIEMARSANPNLAIVARAEGIEQMRALLSKGVTEVVQPELEASMEIAQQALIHLGIPSTQVLRDVDTARRELYSLIRNGEEMELSRHGGQYREEN